MSDEPTTKQALLERIDERWAALQALVSTLSAADMERPLGDGWSAKVHLAHLAAWERSAIGLLRKQHRGDAMGLPRSLWDAHDKGDEGSWPETGELVNATLAATAETQPLDQVLGESASTHEEVIALLNSMTQEDLERPYSHYQPDDPPYNPAPVVGWIHGNTWDHYNEHIGWLEAGLKG